LAPKKKVRIRQREEQERHRQKGPLRGLNPHLGSSHLIHTTRKEREKKTKKPYMQSSSRHIE